MASRALIVHKLDKTEAERRFYARSFGNPVAQLFWEQETLCCGVRGERARLLGDLRRQGFLNSLEDKGFLAASDEVSSGHPEYRLVLRLVRTPRISYCHEWSTLMWRTACLHLLRLMIILAERGLTLRYPHPWHLLFDGPTPVYVHPGSIVPLDPVTFRGAFDRISQFFLRPLALAAEGETALARRFLRDANRGVELCFGALKTAYGLHIADLENLAPIKFLNGRLQEMQDLIIPEEKSQWSQYQADLPFKRSDAWHQKQYRVHEILQEVRPRLVLDLASNLGWYARLAAIEGADVVAVDVDEVCVNRMYSTVREEHSRVLPLVLNVTDPAPGFGVANAWFPPVTERLKSDLVLALAIMHHLVFGTHRLIMSEVAAAFASFTRGALLLEFIPLNSPGCVYSAADRPEAQSWYTLENCVSSFRRVFKKVDILPAAQNSRRLLLCQNKD
jgi:hypothetical protein